MPAYLSRLIFFGGFSASLAARFASFAAAAAAAAAASVESIAVGAVARALLGGLALLLALEPRAGGARHDLLAVVDQIRRLVRLHLRHCNAFSSRSSANTDATSPSIPAIRPAQ